MRSPTSPKGRPQAHFGTVALHNRALRIMGAREYVEKPIDFQTFTDAVCQIFMNWVGQRKQSSAVVS